MTTTGTDVPAPALRLAGTRWAATATALCGLAMTGVAALTRGAGAAAGAAVGTALVCGFFLFGALNTGLAAAYAPRWSMLVALLTYTTQVVGLGLVLAWITRSGSPSHAHPGWLAAAVVLGTVVWTVALVVRALRDPEVQR